MCSDCNNVTNPISTNQIKDVNIRYPDCMCTGDSLNDVLQWLANKACECDWPNFDLSPIQDLLEKEATNVTQCVVLNSLVEAIQTLKQEKDECCEETEYSIPEADWNVSRPLRAIKKGRMVTLTGAVIANGSYTADIANLPSALFPSTNLYIPVAHDFSPSSSYNVFLRILPTGEIRLYFTGSAPSYGTARTVYLDGVSFFLD